MKKYQTKEVKIAIVTILSAVLLYFGVNYLKGINIMKPANYYYVSFPDVSGLTISTPVFLDGYKVGLVNDMEYDYNRLGKIVVELSLDSRLKLPKGSSATMETSLLGDASIILHLNKMSSDAMQLGDTLIGVKPTGLMESVTNNVLPQLDVLLPRVDTILYNLQVLLSNPALTESIDQINRTTANLERSSRLLGNIMSRDIPQITSNLNTVSTDFTQVSSDFTKISSNIKEIDFQKTMGAVEKSINNLEKLTLKLNDPDNSLGLLTNDRELYDNLNMTIESTNALLKDLKENPKRYIHFSVW